MESPPLLEKLYTSHFGLREWQEKRDLRERNDIST